MTLESLLVERRTAEDFFAFFGFASVLFFYPANTAGGPFFSFVNRE
tara:strand:- start:1027 stop:1164 length:138 start_codon:yes stop_codon:yes gene_type:complete